ncbi:hypothetical protein [Deinococcus arcticus]|uniref:Uncharacterized protein n=1 Tax=Deinococcus arcticus TaxID=2136176 RepID=A0A2T3W9S4_9DEIO|nr:hypothetical protein [Deinococcus arcticus]PTA68659.1 hypothetical protein C8263_05245 [Deinococcus arcticus]
MLWFEWYTRRRLWLGLAVVTGTLCFSYARQSGFFSGFEATGRAPEVRLLSGTFTSALDMFLLELPLALLVSWLGASVREQAAFLQHRPLNPRAVIAGRLGFLLGFIAALVGLAFLMQGLFAATPTVWMSRDTFWMFLAQASVLCLLKFSLTATLAMGLSRFVPAAGASLLAVLPLLLNRWSEQGQALVLGVELHYGPAQLAGVEELRPYALALGVAPQALDTDPTTWLRAGAVGLALALLVTVTLWVWGTQDAQHPVRVTWNRLRKSVG